MDKFAENMINICEAIQPYGVAVVIAAFLVCGICFAIPNQKSHEFAKHSVPFIIIGAIVIVGAVYIGEWIFKLISFTAA